MLVGIRATISLPCCRPQGFIDLLKAFAYRDLCGTRFYDGRYLFQIPGAPAVKAAVCGREVYLWLKKGKGRAR
jgi:hypothetical protein